MAVISGGQVIPGNGINRPFTNAGAPSANLFAGACVVGSQLVDITNGKNYVCTATNGTTTATWVVVGSQV